MRRLQRALLTMRRLQRARYARGHPATRRLGNLLTVAILYSGGRGVGVTTYSLLLTTHHSPLTTSYSLLACSSSGSLRGSIRKCWSGSVSGLAASTRLQHRRGGYSGNKVQCGVVIGTAIEV